MTETISIKERTCVALSQDGISAPLSAVYGLQGETTALAMDGFDVWAAGESGHVCRFNIKADRMIWSALVAPGEDIHMLGLHGSMLVVAANQSVTILHSSVSDNDCVMTRSIQSDR